MSRQSKRVAWGMPLISFLLCKFPVYASEIDAMDSGRKMFEWITIFALAAAVLIIIIIIIAQFRKGNLRRMIDEDSERISEKIEQKKQKRENKNEMYQRESVNQGIPMNGMERKNNQGRQVVPNLNIQKPAENQSVMNQTVPSLTIDPVKPADVPSGPVYMEQQEVSLAQYPESHSEKIICLIEKKSNEKIEFPITEKIVIGRNSNLSDLVLKGDKAVSGKHCVFILENGNLFIEDAGSSNGTFVNRNRILQRQQVHNGDELVMGRRKYQIQF